MAQVTTQIKDAVENFADQVDACPACGADEAANNNAFGDTFFEVGRPVFLPWDEAPKGGEGLEGPYAVPIVCQTCRNLMLVNPA